MSKKYQTFRADEPDPKITILPTQPRRPLPIVIPDQPTFSMSDVAVLLNKPLTTVQYWKENDKLTFKADFRGRDYVARHELVAFIINYLNIPCR